MNLGADRTTQSSGPFPGRGRQQRAASSLRCPLAVGAIVAAVIPGGPPTVGQTTSPVANAESPAEPTSAPRPVDGIRDNSFLIEEAYNQEAGVVQHIFTAQFGEDHHPGDQDRGWDLSFTQEWPLFGQTHQLSYTVPYAFVDPPDAEHSSGIGDVMLNYRYQLLDGSGPTPAMAPRWSLIFPSGDDERGFGDGTLGYQFNLPVSTDLSDRVAMHFNAGVTYLPNAELTFSNGRRSDHRDLVNFNLGVSAIYAVTSEFNLMLELLWNSNQELDERSLASGGTPYADRNRVEEVIISPGIRWAYNLSHGVQIVPGLALPIGLSDDAVDYGVFLYLSIEHPFLHQGE